MNPILELQEISIKFGGVVAADRVSLSVNLSSIHGLIGPNGAGKSTLMNIISGIYMPDSGKLFFSGRDITKSPAHQRARMGIARTFQTPRFLQRSSIRDNLLLAADLNDNIGFFKGFLGFKGGNFDSELTELMSIAKITFDWDDDVSSLPFGKRKLLEIVRSLLTHPKVILVDEPAAGLNNKEIEYVMALLNYAAKEKGIGVLLIEHSMDLIMNFCEKIDVLSFGVMIARGTPKEIAVNPTVIEAYLGKEAL